MKQHPINIYVVEDEFIHREALRIAIEENNYVFAGAYADADSAFEAISQAKPDILLVDIALPGILNGITLAQKVKKEWGIPHIFITSFSSDEIIEQALATDPVGYLHKPVDAVSLKAMVMKAMSKQPMELKIDLDVSKSLFVKIGEKLQRVDLDEILVIKSDGDNYISLVTQHKEYYCRTNLKEIQPKLPATFVRVHRAYLINLKQIDTYNEREQMVQLKNQSVPIARSYHKTFLSLLPKI